MIAAILGSLAVILGAFGAHGLKNHLTPEQLTVWHTGVEYQFYHALALLLLFLLSDKYLSPSAYRLNRNLFLGGIALFSGSLYLLSCREFLGLPDGLVKAIGPVTPIGGVLFISGWIYLAFQLSKSSKA